MVVPTLLAVTALSAAPVQQVQLESFRVSPPASVIQGLGLVTVKVNYHRPAVKDRAIWGGLVPYGQVWRAGANAATVLTLSHPATLLGTTIPAGSYALFVQPQKDRWTWMLNRKAAQWGAYFHRPEDDLLRWDTPIRTVPHEEWLRFDLHVVDTHTLRVELRWEKVGAAFDLTFDTKGIYWKHLEETLAKAKPTEWIPWFQAAQYCFQQEIHLDQAHDWVDVSLKAQETYDNQELKARLLRRLGKTAEALAHLDRAIALAKGKTPKEYLDGLQQLREEWTHSPVTELLGPKCCR